MLNEYLKNKNKAEFARNIGITRQALIHILENKSPKTDVRTCIAIKRETGLEPWEYLNGLKELRNLNK